MYKWLRNWNWSQNLQYGNLELPSQAVRILWKDQVKEYVNTPAGKMGLVSMLMEWTSSSQHQQHAQ